MDMMDIREVTRIDVPEHLVGVGFVCKDGKVLGRFLTDRNIRDICIGRVYEVGIFPEDENSELDRILDEVDASIELRIGVPNDEDVMRDDKIWEGFVYFREGSRIEKEFVIKGNSVGKIRDGKFMVVGCGIVDRVCEL